MPRKAPDKVIEHRISLSNFERQTINTWRIENQATAKERNTTERINSVSSAVGNFGLIFAAGVFAYWAGMNLFDLADNTSQRIVTYLDKNRRVNYTADEIGREIIKVQEEQGRLFEELKIVGNPNLTTFDRKRADAIHARLRVLSPRLEVLRQWLDDIVTGQNVGYDADWFGIIGDDVRDEAFASRLQAEYEAYMREMFPDVDPQELSWEVQSGRSDTSEETVAAEIPPPSED